PSRNSKITGAETDYDRKNRSSAQIYFYKRTRLFRLPEIGKRKSWFRVRRKKGEAKEKNCRGQSCPSLRTPRTAGTRFGSCPYLKLRRRNIGSPACSLLRFSVAAVYDRRTRGLFS